MDKLLEQTKATFTELHKIGKRPGKELKTIVVELLNRYPRKYISQCLGVRPGNLTNWKHRNKLKNKIESNAADFIQLPTNNVKEIVTSSSKNITKNSDSTEVNDQLILILPNSIKLIIQNTSMNYSSKIIRQVVEEFAK